MSVLSGSNEEPAEAPPTAARCTERERPGSRTGREEAVASFHTLRGARTRLSLDSFELCATAPVFDGTPGAYHDHVENGSLAGNDGVDGVLVASLALPSLDAQLAAKGLM